VDRILASQHFAQLLSVVHFLEVCLGVRGWIKITLFYSNINWIFIILSANVLLSKSFQKNWMKPWWKENHFHFIFFVLPHSYSRMLHSLRKLKLSLNHFCCVNICWTKVSYKDSQYILFLSKSPWFLKPVAWLGIYLYHPGLDRVVIHQEIWENILSLSMLNHPDVFWTVDEFYEVMFHCHFLPVWASSSLIFTPLCSQVLFHCGSSKKYHQ